MLRRVSMCGSMNIRIFRLLTQRIPDLVVCAKQKVYINLVNNTQLPVILFLWRQCKVNFHLNFAVEYDCSHRSCVWDYSKEGEDWGYYSKNSKSDGECYSCRQRCSSDPNCSGVECGSNYCSWWKNGKCSLLESSHYSGSVYTCRKRSIGKLKQIHLIVNGALRFCISESYINIFQ